MFTHSTAPLVVLVGPLHYCASSAWGLGVFERSRYPSETCGSRLLCLMAEQELMGQTGPMVIDKLKSVVGDPCGSQPMGKAVRQSYLESSCATTTQLEIVGHLKQFRAGAS